MRALVRPEVYNEAGVYEGVNVLILTEHSFGTMDTGH